MLKLKRLCSLLLIATLLISSVSMLFVNAEEIPENSEADITEETTLPSSVDNSESPYFPQIGDSYELVADAAFATAYYQLTYEMNRALGVETTKDNTFNPNYVYALTNGGENNGSSPEHCYNVLKTAGCLTNKTSLYQDYAGACDEWPTTYYAWRESLRYRIKDVIEFDKIGEDENQVTSPDDTDLLQIKTALNNGNILHFSTHMAGWNTISVQKNDSVPENDKYYKDFYVSYITELYSEQSMVIVGYEDDIWCDINGNSEVDNGEMGAFKVAASRGADFYDGGFCWIAYDALNKTSSVEGVPAYEGRVADIDSISSIVVEEPREKEILVSFWLTGGTRSKFAVHFTAEGNGEKYEDTYLTGVNYTDYPEDGIPVVNSLNYVGEMVYPLRDLIPDITTETLDDYEITITIEDTLEDNSSLEIMDIRLIDEYAGTECSVNNEVYLSKNISINGSEYSAKVKSNVFVHYIGFENPTLHYKTGDNDFVAVPMEEYIHSEYTDHYSTFTGYYYKACIENTTDAKLYFSDAQGNIDDNNGEYYTAGVGFNGFNTKGVREELKINDFRIINGSPDIYHKDGANLIHKFTKFSMDISGGYESYGYRFIIENLDTGEVTEENKFYFYDDVKEYESFGEKYYFTEGTYRHTVEVRDWVGETASYTITYKVEDHPFEIESINHEKSNYLLSETIVFESVTAFENIEPNSFERVPLKSNFLIKDSDGKVVWKETLEYDEYSHDDATSTTYFTFKPTRVSEYTLTVSATDCRNEYAEKTISFTVSDKIIGDVNGDGNISIMDATTIQRYIAKLIEEDELYKELTDCDKNSVIDVVDATLIRRYIAKLDNSANTGETIEYVPKTYTVTFINTIGWEAVNCELFSPNPELAKTWPGVAMTPVGVDESGYAIYTVEVPEGITRLAFNYGNSETLRIDYAGGDKTYCPVENELGTLYDLVEV